MKTIVAAFLTFGLVGTAAAMPVSVFLPKAEALMKKGPMALFSSDVGLLKKEMNSASGKLRDERLSILKSGGRPSYCPPAKASLNSNEIMAHLRAIPAGERGMSFKTALGGFMAKKFPCRA